MEISSLAARELRKQLENFSAVKEYLLWGLENPQEFMTLPIDWLECDVYEAVLSLRTSAAEFCGVQDKVPCLADEKRDAIFSTMVDNILPAEYDHTFDMQSTIINIFYKVFGDVVTKAQLLCFKDNPHEFWEESLSSLWQTDCNKPIVNCVSMLTLKDESIEQEARQRYGDEMVDNCKTLVI